MALAITTLPSTIASVGNPYSSTVVATGGTAPYVYASIIGTPPQGLTLNPATGAITGTPTTQGIWTFELQVTDSAMATATAITSINVSGGSPPPSGYPVAAHTFDFVRVYLSTRTGGAPGTGGWTNPVTIFDGNLQPLIPTCETFSAAALIATDHSGIIGDARIGGFGGTSTTLAFLGDGLPTAPITISFTGQQDTLEHNPDYWDIGISFNYGGASYIALVDGGVVTMIKSGTPWATQDAANGPTGINADGTIAALQHVDSTVYVFSTTDQTDTHFAAWGFDLTTNRWGASFAPVTIADFQAFDVVENWSNGFYKFSNGDFLVIYSNQAGNVVCRLWTPAGGWAAPQSLGAGSYANSVMDPGLGIVHIFTYAVSGDALGAVNYGTFTHTGSVVTANIAQIPAPVGNLSNDGVNHPSIQNGMLFVPRDDSADFTNAVWVGLLPAPTVFHKEFLPVPIGETNAISTYSIGNGGSGYALNDTFIVNGGTNPANGIISGITTNEITASNIAAAGSAYAVNDTGTVNGGSPLATYKILAVRSAGNVHSLNGSGGSGYSIATNVATTRGGAQPGVGTGLTLDITSLGAGNSIATVNINNAGTGYAVGDTGTVNGGGTLATYTILSIWPTGAVVNYVLTTPGGGYTVASNVATTDGGGQPGVGAGFTINILSLASGVNAVVFGNLVSPLGGGYSVVNGATTSPAGVQPGVGTGLTINILSVKNKIPSCAYMLFPNGYTLPPTPPPTLACPVGGGSATVGTPYTSAAPVVTGGTPPYTFSASGLPPGLNINATTGVISGTPTTAGTFPDVITVTDANGLTGSSICPIVVKNVPPPVISETGTCRTILHLWQHSVSPQVEIITDRNDDWTNCGTPGNKFFQGLRLNGDTFGVNKSIAVRDSDTGALHTIQPSPINHAGRTIKPYSFATPFTAHMVRRESFDMVPYRQFGIEYVWEETPEFTYTWKTQRTNHGLKGFHHVQQIIMTYASNAPITLTIGGFDGTAPQIVTLPSTAGVFEKVVVTLTANKQLLYEYLLSSTVSDPTGAFQIWQDQLEVRVGQWGRTGEYINYPLVGGRSGDNASI